MAAIWVGLGHDLCGTNRNGKIWGKKSQKIPRKAVILHLCEYWQQPFGFDEYFSLLSSTSVWIVNLGLEKTALCMGLEIPRADLGPCQSEDPA